MCFDSARNALVLFGGYGQGNTNVINYTYEIVYRDAPTVLKQPTRQVATLGQNTELTVVVGGAPMINYQWQKNGIDLTDGGNISGSTSNILQIAAVSADDFGNYQLKMNNACGTATSDPIALRIATTAIAVSVVSTKSLTMDWFDPAATLQTAPSAAGPWIALPAATPPYTIVPEGTRGFFRLLH
jgi:hypothetical protein